MQLDSRVKLLFFKHRLTALVVDYYKFVAASVYAVYFAPETYFRALSDVERRRGKGGVGTELRLALDGEKFAVKQLRLYFHARLYRFLP